VGGTCCGGRKGISLDRKVENESPVSDRAGFRGPLLVVEVNEAFNPVDLRLLSAVAVMVADRADADKQAGRIGDVHGMWAIRSPNWRTLF